MPKVGACTPGFNQAAVELSYGIGAAEAVEFSTSVLFCCVPRKLGALMFAPLGRGVGDHTSGTHTPLGSQPGLFFLSCA